ncbi:MAG: hypothetical protein KAJ14_07790, partial [Candidatus Omnitrophica bacterium]|nr:hypothetical protein [Candidatus Omnitrophota bacterium]
REMFGLGLYSILPNFIERRKNFRGGKRLFLQPQHENHLPFSAPFFGAGKGQVDCFVSSFYY